MLEIYKINPVQTPCFGLELSDSFHAVLQNGSLEQIQHAEIRHGREDVLFGDYFQVVKNCSKQSSVDQQSAEEQQTVRLIQWEGDFTRVHGIGRGWQQGEMQITGSVGDCLGEGMSGGQIIVKGNAADAVGNSLSGGQIIVEGNAGNWIGSSSSGQLQGMTGGEIFIYGSAGNHLGARMRRGTIAVQKEVGDDIGKQMLAGSILLFGNYRGQPGLGMKRGSIILFQNNHQVQNENRKQVLGFHCDYASTCQPVYLRALLKHLEKNSAIPIDQSLYDTWYRRYSGDMTEGGRGEILVRSESVLS